MYHIEHSGGVVGYIRGRFSRTVEDFFREASASFRFPYYFGMNWAAFDECLSDLEWLSFSRILFIVDGAELLFIDEKARRDCVNVFFKCLKEAATYWEEQKIPFICMINSTQENALRELESTRDG
jgi:hypothetical protein